MVDDTKKAQDSNRDPEDIMFDNFKDKFQGFDKDGNPIIEDDGKLSSFNVKDFPKFAQNLQSQFGNKSYEDEFNRKQYEDISKQGNKFEGFSNDQAIFRNEKGDLENFGAEGGFAKYLKKVKPDQQFNAMNLGSGRSDTSYAATTDYLNQKKATTQKTGSNIGSVLNAQQKAQTNIAQPQSVNQPKPETSSTIQETQPQAVPSSTPTKAPESGFKIEQPKQPAVKTQIAKPAKSAPVLLGDLSSYAQKQAGQVAKEQAGQAIKPVIQQPIQQAKQQLVQPVKQQLGEVTQQIGQVTGLPTQAITNPAGYAKQQLLQGISGQTGVDTGTLGTAASLMQGNVAQNAQNLAESELRKQAIEKLTGATGMSNDYANMAMNLLSGGNVLENAQNLAVKEAEKQAINKAALAAGVDPTGGAISSALDIGRSLLSGGSTQDKGKAAAEAAAKGALAYATGGLVSPETLALASGLSQKAEKKLGGAGFLLSPTSQALDVGSKAVGEGLGAVGDIGGRTGRSFGQAATGIKALTKGNIGEGLKNLGSSAGNLVSNLLLKDPATLAKAGWNIGGDVIHGAGKALGSVASGVGKAIKSIFCFAPNTQILMANGKFKKIKDIKLGEEVMLGGKVTAIGQSTSDEMFTYNGVEVSGGHAIYEDGTWKRVRDSHYAVKLDLPDDTLVYPMSTENHLIVTKNQIWADMEEVSDTYDKTDTDILKELNGQKQANQMLDVFLKQYFRKK